jgi:hypothetical protein
LALSSPGRKWLAGAALVSLALALQGCAQGLTASPSDAPSASAGTGCTLTVEITSSAGSTWGAVTVRVGGSSYTFGSPARTVSLSCGSTVQLSETPIDSTEWPFQGWRLGTRRLTTTDVTAIVTGAEHVAAVYVPANQPTSSPAPSAPG